MKKKYEQARKSIEEARMDYYLCADVSYFDDDIKLECFKCRKDIYARPYYPRNSKLICLKCVLKIAKEKK
jgi:hypothetical protein